MQRPCFLWICILSLVPWFPKLKQLLWRLLTRIQEQEETISSWRTIGDTSKQWVWSTAFLVKNLNSSLHQHCSYEHCLVWVGQAKTYSGHGSSDHCNYIISILEGNEASSCPNRNQVLLLPFEGTYETKSRSIQ